MSNPKQKQSAAEKQARRERKKKFMIIFVSGNLFNWMKRNSNRFGNRLSFR